MKYLLLFILSFSATASVSEQDFKIVSTEFIKFIIPHGKKMDSGYSRSIELQKYNLSFGAVSTEPIQVFMGSLKDASMTPDSLALMLCHEVGHNTDLARFYVGELQYAFAHLEQDYYATRACMFPYMKESSARSTGDLSSVPLSLQTKCEVTFTGKDKNFCLRAVKASIAVIEGLYRHERARYDRWGLPAPTLERQWLGPDDDIQARLLTYINGIFNEAPIK